jgi:aspartate/methionine/tyrosine aminotransferase
LTASALKPLARTSIDMPASGIREIVNLAIGMKDVIRLEVGEPNFATPPHIVEAAHAGALAGFTTYTQSSGMLSLREIIAESMERLNGRRVTPSQITVGVGGVQVMSAVFLALLEPGDEVLIPDPAWPNFGMAVRFREAVPVPYRLSIRDGFVPRVEALEPLVTPRTKVLVINTPCNPTGAVFPRETVEALVAFARRHNLYVLSDEVYEQLVFEGQHHSAAPFDPQRVITLHSLSKTYAMTGWRIGFVIANEEISSILMKLQEPLISCVAGPVQKAAEAALTGPQDCVREMRDSYRERRDAVVAVLEQHGAHLYTPSGAFYVMVDVSRAGIPSRDFALALLREKHVAVAPGSAFGQAGKDLVRVSLATEKSKLIEGVRRLCQYVDERAALRAQKTALEEGRSNETT